MIDRSEYRWEKSFSLGLTRRLCLLVFDYSYLVRVPTSVCGAAFVFWLAKHNGLVSLKTAIYASASTFCAIGAGFSLNDVTDACEDRVNNPWRPVAKGSISARSAILTSGTLAILAL